MINDQHRSIQANWKKKYFSAADTEDLWCEKLATISNLSYHILEYEEKKKNKKNLIKGMGANFFFLA